MRCDQNCLELLLPTKILTQISCKHNNNNYDINNNSNLV